ncbi:MAG: MlaD family protein [Actinomycetota bacterium]|nr:MlaD family protein [Actinomycetota bacterium]
MKDGSTPAHSRNQPADPSEGEPGNGAPVGDGNRSRDRGSVASRVLAVGALVAVVLLVTMLLLGGGGDHKYNLLFQTGGQLVKGNEVLIGGTPVGTVGDIKLTDNNQAEVSITVNQALHEGTTAVIRATSLSGVANHYVSLTPGPNNSPELAKDATLTGADTTTPVDLDQLFNIFNGRARQSLRLLIQGFDQTYVGKGQQANKTYKYFAPSLSATDRVLQELNRDQGVLTNFIVNSSRVFTAVSERSNDLSGLISNSNQALGAIASQNRAFDRSLAVLPSTLRQGNTTFVNLRATLDDLDPLVNTSKVATRNLDPFLRKVQPVLHRAVPVFTDLRKVVNLPGANNDLADSVKALPKLEPRARTAFPAAVNASNASLPFIRFARPYSPDLFGGFTALGQVTAYYDANGHFARVQTANANPFCSVLGPPGTPATPANCSAPGSPRTLEPIPADRQFEGLNFKIYKRCPGGSTQPIPGSNPFTDNGNLGPGDCNTGDVPPGP